MDFRLLIEQFVRVSVSGRPGSASDVQKGLGEETGTDLTQYVGAGTSVLDVRATIAKHLEVFAHEKKVMIRVSPGGEPTFQWITRSDPAPSSLAKLIYTPDAWRTQLANH